MEDKKIIVKYLRNILKQRELSEKDFAFFLSKGRTKLIKRLTCQELEEIKNTMLFFDDTALLNGIYTIMKEMNVIPSMDCTTRDSLIIGFLKCENHITQDTNELNVINHKTDTIKIVAPFENLTYIEKYIIAKFAGDIYLKRSALLN